jgi:signal transduction histidine kinase
MDRKIIKFRNNVLGDVSSRQYLKTPYFVFAIAILLTVVVTFAFYKNVESKDKSRFLADVAKVDSIIKNRLDDYTTLLKAGRGFLMASKAQEKEVTRESFAAFVRELELENKFPGAQGMGFVKRIKPEEQSAITEKMRAEGYKDFRFFYSDENSGKTFPVETLDKEGYVILYLEPLAKDSNSGAVGYIISSEAQKRATIEKALSTGEAAISEKLTLIPLPRTTDSPRRPGFQLYIPIYKSGNVPETENERKEKIDSLLYCPFRAVNFVSEVQTTSGVTDISFAIYDQTVSPESMLAESDPAPGDAPADGRATQSLFQNLYSGAPFEQILENINGNETWLIKYRTLPSFHSNSSMGWTLIIFFFGLGISLVLFFITLSQSKAHSNLALIAQDLARSEKVKDEFIAVVSHELRTPLNSITGGVTILRNRGINDETRAKALDIIDKNVRSQATLVEDMIVFSDINAGKEYLHLKPLNFTVLLDKAYNELLLQAAAKNISLVKGYVMDGTLVAGDEAKLEKVVNSLISNSLKFTSPGDKIEIALRKIENYLELRVKDNGFGIHPQVLPYVFDLFKQGDSSTVRRHGGLGLGLTLSSHIVRLHGGTLQAESAGVDKGATFILRLPTLEGTV